MGKMFCGTGIAFMLALVCGSAVEAQTSSAKAPVVDPTVLAYATPGIFAKLPGGRVIHLKCMGSGSPTVILTAGMGDWSAIWRKIQPEIAKETRACAWDRPGYGFSSGSAKPQTVSSRVSDLEAALKIARIHGPYIAVGHSLGSYESLMFKDRNPRTVVGMVLVDPSIPAQFRRMQQVAPAFAAVSELQPMEQLLQKCGNAVKAGKLAFGGPDPDDCLAQPSTYPPALATALARLDLTRFPTMISLAQNVERDSEYVARSTRHYGAMPLIVLTAGVMQPRPDMAQAAKDQIPAVRAEWMRGHDELAALSSRGRNEIVAGSTHYIQLNHPDAVIAAVDDVIKAARASAAGDH